MEDLTKIILQTIIRIVDHDLSSLLVGCLITIFLLVRHWKIPEKWEFVKKRLDTINRKIDRFSNHEHDYDEDSE